LSVESARNWFEINFPITDTDNIFKVKGTDSTVINLKPLLNWEMAELSNDSLWSVVELPWEYENGFVTFANPEVKYQLESNGLQPLQVEKLVIVKSRIKNEIYGFKMRVLPDFSYVTQHGDNIYGNSYLNKDTDLSGFVLYYSINDEYINGWKYVEGKVTAKLELFESKNEVGANTPSMVKSSWEYTLIENCSYLLISWKDMTAIREAGCSSQYFSVLVMDGNQLDSSTGLADNTMGSGGSGSTVTPAAVDPCAYLKKLMSDQVLAAEIANYMALAAGSGSEHGFIRDSNGNKKTHSKSTNTNITFEFESGKKYSEQLHSHPTLSGGTPFPSSNDIRNLYSLYKKGYMSNVNTFRYIIVSEMGVSCLMITDAKAFDAFGQGLNLDKSKLGLQTLFDGQKLYYNSQPLEDHLKDLLKLLNDANSGLTYIQGYLNGKNNPEWQVKQSDANNNVININCN
jgi:hypothetical protein